MDPTRWDLITGDKIYSPFLKNHHRHSLLWLKYLSFAPVIVAIKHTKPSSGVRGGSWNIYVGSGMLEFLIMILNPLFFICILFADFVSFFMKTDQLVYYSMLAIYTIIQKKSRILLLMRTWQWSWNDFCMLLSEIMVRWFMNLLKFGTICKNL